MNIDIDIDALRKHIGTKIVEEDIATQAALRGLSVTFDRDERIPGQGERIPPGLASGVFPASVAQGDTR